MLLLLYVDVQPEFCKQSSTHGEKIACSDQNKENSYLDFSDDCINFALAFEGIFLQKRNHQRI